MHPSSRIQADTLLQLDQHYTAHPHWANAPLVEKWDAVSRLLLGRPYLAFPLGEGPTGKYDQRPLYRWDAFDCLTFVETVMALSLADNAEAFVRYMQRIRYQEGNIDFVSRNHFMEPQWNNQNEQAGFLRDVTPQFIDPQSNSPVYQMDYTPIHLVGWYAKLGSERIYIAPDTEHMRQQLWHALREEGARLAPGVLASQLSYIPLRVLFNEARQADVALFDHIPHGAIVQIVRPHWDLTEAIGTCLNVSHLGFAFWREGILYFRHASSEKKQVVEIPLADYLRNTLDSPTIGGIHVQAVTEVP